MIKLHVDGNGENIINSKKFIIFKKQCKHISENIEDTEGLSENINNYFN